MKRKKNQPRAQGKKREYRQPRLAVHGDLRTITLVKKGKKADGGAKPATKASGANA